MYTTMQVCAHVHVNKVQEQCRVCGRLLVVPRDKKSRWSYQCTEFAADLHSVFGIDTHNDAVNIHPLVIDANKLWIEAF